MTSSVSSHGDASIKFLPGSPAAGRIAWTIFALFVVAGAVGILLQANTGRTTFNLGIPFILTASVFAVSWTAIGAFIVARRPGHPVGWLLFLSVILWGPQTLTFGIVATAIERGIEHFPGMNLALLFSSWTGAPILLITFTLLLLIYPSGRLTSKRWAIVIWAALGGMLVYLILQPLEPGLEIDPGLGLGNPFAVSTEVWANVEPALWLATAVALACLFIAAISLFLRFRRSQGIERQQLKWFVYPAIPFILTFAPVSFSNAEVLTPLFLLLVIGFVASALALALGIAFSILRYRLYDIDFIVKRSIVYVALSAALVAIYLGSVLVLQNLVRLAIGQESSVAIVGATLIVAALFNPLRTRLQDLIDQRFYRARYDAARTLNRFGSSLSETVEMDAQMDLLLEVVTATVQPEHASIWVRSRR